MKLGKWILGSIGVVGAFLVGEGIITGAELTSLQSIVGLAMGGGGLTVGLVLSILEAIPKQVVSSAFDKATEKYGEDKVLSFLDNVDAIITAVETLTDKVDTVQADLNEAKEARNKLLS